MEQKGKAALNLKDSFRNKVKSEIQTSNQKPTKDSKKDQTRPRFLNSKKDGESESLEAE